MSLTCSSARAAGRPLFWASAMTSAPNPPTISSPTPLPTTAQSRLPCGLPRYPTRPTRALYRYVLASDASAVIERTRRVTYLNDGDMVVITRGAGYQIKTLDNIKLIREVQELEMSLQEIQKGEYKHFMLKEICEQPEVLENCMRGRLNHDVRPPPNLLPLLRPLSPRAPCSLLGRQLVELTPPLPLPSLQTGDINLGGLTPYLQRIIAAPRIIICACGTSWHAALTGEYMIENLAKIPVEVEYASEFRYRNPVMYKSDVVIAVSQSGETADTLAAISLAKKHGCLTVGICNTVGSTIARETDCGVYLHAGPEIGVASTKAFTAQICTRRTSHTDGPAPPPPSPGGRSPAA